MIDLATLIQHSSSWLFIPAAIVLGALHGLEPGHSKTMMAAFIIAIRGTVLQAVLLGLAATLSHTAVVWVVALTGLYFGKNMQISSSEVYFQLASAILMLAVALWMLWRTWQLQRFNRHDHGALDPSRIDTGHGVVHLSLVHEGAVSHFRLAHEAGASHGWAAQDVQLYTERPDGQRQVFDFVARANDLESLQEVPKPHVFRARLSLGHHHHHHDYDISFPQPDPRDQLIADAQVYQDPHEMAHAHDIQKRFADQNVTTGQIILFGLTGGLVPCPASITVLLLCLQLKRFSLGMTLVLSFSIGLALTMVASGVLAALSLRHISRHWNGFGDFAAKAPFLSGGLIVLLGLYMGYQSLMALA